jgi:hypothetical protein
MSAHTGATPVIYIIDHWPGQDEGVYDGTVPTALLYDEDFEV